MEDAALRWAALARLLVAPVARNAWAAFCGFGPDRLDGPPATRGRCL